MAMCPICSTENPDSATFCKQCGATLAGSSQGQLVAAPAVASDGQQSTPAWQREPRPAQAEASPSPLGTDPGAYSPPSPPPLGAGGATAQGGPAKGVMLRALLQGVVFTGGSLVAFYVLGGIWPRVEALVFERGWVQYAIVALFGWSLAILWDKFRTIKRQRQALCFNLLPPGQPITLAAVDEVLQGIDAECRRQQVVPQATILVQRVRRALESFKTLGKVEEVRDMLRYEADLALSAAESSYTLLKVFIWAIPIFGFIGTVLGIGDAVGGFSTFIQSVQDVSELNKRIKEALGGVTSGLSVAFDTTLLALLLSVPVMVLSSHCQKREEELLGEVETFGAETLLNRLEGDRGTGSRTAPPEVGLWLESLRELVAQALRRLETSLEKQEASLEKQLRLLARFIEVSLSRYGQVLETPLRDFAGRFDGQLSTFAHEIESLGSQFGGVQSAIGALGQTLSTTLDRSHTVAEQFTARQEKLVEQLKEIQPLALELHGIRDSLSAVPTSLAQETRAFQAQGQQWAEELQGSTQHLVEALKDTQGKLADVLAQETRAFQVQGQQWAEELQGSTQHLVEALKDTQAKLADVLAQETRAFQAQGQQWAEELQGSTQHLVEVLRDNQGKLADVERLLRQPRPIRIKTIEMIEEGLPQEG